MKLNWLKPQQATVVRSSVCLHFLIIHPAAGSALEAEFELLMMMVERYEAEHVVVKSPDPVAAIEFAIEQRGLSPADLRDVLGSRQRVHEILQRKRRLSLEHVRALHDKLLIPADVLIQAY